MLVVMLRTVFIYCIIVFAMRMMGKKQLGELQPSELVSTILISNLASICIESPEIPIAGSVVPVLLIVVLEILISAAAARSKKLETLISGSPKVVVRRGVIDQRVLQELRFSADDLLEALRGKDVFELSDVELAIVETSGSVSVCRRPGSQPVSVDDMPAPKPQPRLPKLPVMVMGEADPQLLQCLALTEADIDRLLKKEGCSARQVLVLLCDAALDYQLIKKEQA